MFFRRKKKGDSGALPPPPDLGPAGGAAEAASTQFLTGDAARDRRSLEGLLDEIARVSERVARVKGQEDLEELLTYIVDASIERTGAERGLLVIASDEGELRPHVARKRGKESLADDERFSTSAVRKVLETGEPLKDMFNSAAEAMDLGASVYDLKLRALMCVPLQARREDTAPNLRARGVLYVDSKAATREFTQQDLSYFTALSQQIAVALESARLHLDSLMRTRLEQSLELASAIQRGLMPQVPGDVPGYELFGWYLSAERTSGDFYDFVRTRRGHYGVVVGDVTGHGIGPALITASAQASLRSFLKVIQDPGEALTMLNQDLAERIDDGMFLTLFLAVLRDDGNVLVLNAGHPPPIVWRAASGELETVTAHGPALGMVPDYDYSQGAEVTLESGDLMLAFSDGLTEARPAGGGEEMLGDEGLEQSVREVAPEAESARDFTEALVERLLAFCGEERDDDMTIVAVRRR